MAEDDPIRIKDYQIHLPPLGEGAYGKVYRATYRGISDRALKLFRPGAVDLSNMARELEKLSQVAEHQGIVTLHDFDLLADSPYYAMGLHADQDIDGNWETRTVDRLCGNVDPREGWRVVRDIADALAYLHRHQIVHCDVKPTNILLTDETPHHVKICDFGQSRGLAAEGFEPVGTPLYASPEQLRNPRDSADGKGFRWDVYGFGVVAYKLLTGRLPRLQSFADAEHQSFDPNSTLSESSLEATLAETGNAVDLEQLATLTEAVEEIEWPSDANVPGDRKELIEQCLELDPDRRPADMREVWSRIEQLDQQSRMRRARRLNSLFAFLLVIAIWASGFAFVQARKAKEATEAALQASEEYEKSAGAAVDLMLLFVSELNKGDISGAGAERLYSIVAENAATFLENRSKDRTASSRILRLSAQTASLQGRQSLEHGNLEEALKNFTTAFEIRSNLAEDEDSREALAVQASRNLMAIGRIHEHRGDYEQAASAYARALDWRNRIEGGGDLFSLRHVRALAEAYEALSRMQFLQEDHEAALSTLEDLLGRLDDHIEEGDESAAPAHTMEAVHALDLKAQIESEADEPEAAAATYEELMRRAQSLEDAPPSVAEQADDAYLEALRSLGRLRLEQDEPEAALARFREEIELREEAAERRPYEPERRIALAEAYALASRALDPEEAGSRSLRIFYLEQAVSLIGKLPSDIRNRSDVQEKIIDYNERLSSLLEEQE